MDRPDTFRLRVRKPRPQHICAQALLPTLNGAATANLGLDLGAGAGELCIEARNRGWNMVGADFRHENLALLTSTDHIPGVQVDLENPLPFAANVFDMVMLVEVIEHIHHMENLVREIHRILKPGGQFIVTTPNVAYLTYRWRSLRGFPPKGEGYHLRFLTSHTLRQHLANTGFTIEARASNHKRYPNWHIPLFLEPLLAKRLAYRCRKV